MKTPLAIIILAVVAVSSSLAEDNDNWPQFGGGPDHNNFRKTKNTIRCPKVLWHMEGPHGQPTIWEGVLYAGGDSLYCIDAKTGDTTAKWPEGGSMKVAAAPVLDKDRVIARNNNGDVTAFTHKLEDELWTYSPDSAGGNFAFPAVLDEGMYVFSHGAKVLAVDAAKGEKTWEFDVENRASVDMAPAAANGKVFFGTASGSFFALDIKTGEQVWKYSGEATFGWTDPVVAFDMVFVGDRGIKGGRRGAMNAFQAKTGTQVWCQDFGATGLSTPGIMPGYVFAGFARVVACFDAKDGKIRQDTYFKGDSNPFGSPTLINDTMYCGNLDGCLYAYDAKTAKMKWAFRVGTGEDAQAQDFVYWKGMIFLSSTKGLFAIGQDPEKKSAPAGFILENK
ncbi:MAG: PQQ-binding-like beta-propeller repeat protein [Planctomycetota bacterium]